MYIVEEWYSTTFLSSPAEVNFSDLQKKSFLNEKYAFRVISEFEKENIKYSIVQFFKFTRDSVETTYNGDFGQKLYIIKSEQIILNCSEIPSRFSFVTLSLPLKIRFKEFAVEPNLNISGVLQWHPSKLDPFWNRTSFIVGIGFGTTSVNSDASEGSPAEMNGLFTIITGITFRVDDNLDILISTGIDRNLSQNSKNWAYQNDPWLGIGIGYNLTKRSANNIENQP